MIVQSPDGKTIDFGNMPPEQVQAAMQKMYPPQNGPSALSSMNTSMQNAASFGMGSPIEGLANAAAGKLKGLVNGQSTPSFGDLYDQGRQQYAQQVNDAEKTNPIASGIGSVLGGVGSIPAVDLAKAGAAGSGMIGKAWDFIKGNTLPGIGLGAVSGFGNAPGDLENQAKGAGLGAMVGGILGTAAPAALGATGEVMSPLMQRFMSQQKLNSASGDLAAKNLTDVMSRDRIDVSKIPLDQNVLQSGGKAATARAEAIATRGGQGGDMIADYAAKQRTQLPNDLSEALGGNFAEKNYPALLDAIKQRAKADAGPLYDTAYANLDKINDPQINQALDRAVAAGDWPVLSSEAKKLAAYEGNVLGNIDATGAIRSFSTKDLDYMTRALRNLGQGTEGMGAFGNKTPLGAMRSNTAGEIRSRLKDLNPDFATATDRYAGEIALHDAAQEGKAANLLGNNWKQALVDYNKMGQSEKTAWRVGQAENLQTMIANNPGAALTRMNSPQFKKVMQNFYSPSEYDSLMGSVQQLAKENGQIRQITGNSRTAARAVQQAGDKMDENGLAESVINNGPKGAIAEFLKKQVLDKFTNTPIRQGADAQVARGMLSSPFQLAGQNVGGQMQPQVMAALSGNPMLQQLIKNQMAKANNDMRGIYSAPIANSLISGGVQ
jgi:hypothetical protein